MTLNGATGQVEFGDPSFVASPLTTRAEFLASALGRHAELSVKNEPWCSWKTSETSIGAERFHAILYFHGERLAMVSLAIAVPGESASWSDWSESAELDRKRVHDGWLRAQIGRARTFPWGPYRQSTTPEVVAAR